MNCSEIGAMSACLAGEAYGFRLHGTDYAKSLAWE